MSGHTYHQFDPDSVTNPVTGRPYGPGPLWCGTEPMDYPDPLCVCGGPWVDDQCVMRNTLVGAGFELAEARRALGREIVATLRRGLGRARTLCRWLN